MRDICREDAVGASIWWKPWNLPWSPVGLMTRNFPKVQRTPALTVESELLAVNKGGTAEASVPFGDGSFFII